MKLLLSAVTAALVLVSGATSAPEFALRPASHTAKTVTFTWPRQPGADGYLFLRNGVPVARTLNPSTTTATFWKGSRYAVDVLHLTKGGRVTRGPRAVYAPPHAVGPRRPTRLIFVPAPSPPFALHVVDSTAKTVTFGWKAQPGAQGYRFVRNGAVIARTMKGSTTTATFWKGSRYAVDLLRLGDKTAIPIRRAGAFVAAHSTRARTKRGGLVFVPAPKIDFRLRLVRTTKRTVTFGWKRQKAAQGYRFLRNGVAVAQTFVRSTTRATFWKGRTYEVQMLRLGPGKKATPVMSTLAYSAKGATTKSGVAPSSPRTGDGSRSAAPSPKSPESPKAPESPKPPSSTPTRPPATPAQPAPAKPAPPPPASPPPASPPPSPPQVGPGGSVTLSGSYSPGAFFQAVAVAPAGPLTVRGSFTIQGDLQIDRPQLTIDGARIAGVIEFESGASGSKLVNSQAQGFNVMGADNITIEGSTLDGEGVVSSNKIWDNPAGNTPDGFVIRNNTIRNFFVAADGSAHSEGIFIGFSTGGLIDGNTFENNGNTSHIFFSYWGTAAYQGQNPATLYPRNMCVRGNSFGATHGAYFDVNFREEIPSSANITIQRDASSTKAEFYGSC